MDKQKHRGKDKEGVIFPVAPNLSEMSDSYLQFNLNQERNPEAESFSCNECQYKYDLPLLECWQGYFEKTRGRGMGCKGY